MWSNLHPTDTSFFLITKHQETIYNSAGDLLRDKIKPDSHLLIASAYLTIYADEALRQHLDGIEQLRFLFGESVQPHACGDDFALMKYRAYRSIKKMGEFSRGGKASARVAASCWWATSMWTWSTNNE